MSIDGLPETPEEALIRAVTFVPTWNGANRSFTSDDRTLEALSEIVSEPVYRGRLVAHLLHILPTPDGFWISQGVPNWTHQPDQTAALTLVAAAASNSATMQALLSERRKLREQGRPDLVASDLALRATSVLSAWNFHAHDPDAIALLIKDFVSASDIDLAGLASSRYQSIVANRAGVVGLAGKFAETVEAVGRLGLPRDQLKTLTDTRDRLITVVREQPNYRQPGRSNDQASDAAFKALRDRAANIYKRPYTRETIDAFAAQCNRLAEADPDRAAATLLKGIDTFCRGYPHEDATEYAEQVADRILGGLRTQLVGGSGLSNRVLLQAVKDTFKRREVRAIIMDDGIARVDESALSALSDEAAKFGIETDIIKGANELLQYALKSRQALHDAEQLAPIEPGELPTQATWLTTITGYGYLDYNNLEELLGDVERHFVNGEWARENGLSPMDHTGEVSRILEGLRLDFSDWIANREQKEFVHTRTLHGDDARSPYQHSGTAFTGTRFRGWKLKDGRLRISIEDARGSRDDLTRPLDEMAHTVGRFEDVRFERLPAIRFALVPAQDEATRIANLSVGMFEGVSASDPPPLAGIRYADIEVKFDASRLASVVESILGVAPTTTLRDRVANARRLPRWTAQNEWSDAEISIGPFQFATEQWRDRPAQLTQSAELVLPASASWRLAPRSGETDFEPELRVGSRSVTVTVNASGVSPTEANRNAQAFERVWRSQRHVHAGLSENWGSPAGSTWGLRLALSDAPDALQREVSAMLARDSVATGPALTTLPKFLRSGGDMGHEVS